MYLIDYLITLVSVGLSVCVYVCPQIGCRTISLRPQFLTNFHQILHAARKFGSSEGYRF